MRGHVVTALRGVTEPGRVFRYQALKELGEIAAHIGIGVLLDEERGGRVPDKDGQEPALYALTADPLAYVAGDFVQTLSACRDSQLALRLSHSAALFDRDAFSQIARLIHVASASDGDVIGEQLKRHNLEYRGKKIGRGGY